MADGTVGVLQATSPDRLIDNDVVANDASTTVYRQKVAVVDSRVTTAAVTQVASATGATTLKALNALRRSLFIFNDSTAALYVLLGAGTVSSTLYTVKIPAQGYYELPRLVYTGVVTGAWATANGFAYVTELTA